MFIRMRPLLKQIIMEIKNGIIIDGVLHEMVELIDARCLDFDCSKCSLNKECNECKMEHESHVCIYNHRTTKTNQKYPSVNL